MPKPTEEEYLHALEVAGQMREKREDPDFLAKSLLNLNYRYEYVRKVMHAAERYMRFGQEEREHRDLLRAIEAAHQAETRDSGKKDSDIGL